MGTSNILVMAQNNFTLKNTDRCYSFIKSFCSCISFMMSLKALNNCSSKINLLITSKNNVLLGILSYVPISCDIIFLKHTLEVNKICIYAATHCYVHYHVEHNLLNGSVKILKVSVKFPAPMRVKALTATVYIVKGSNPPITVSYEVFTVEVFTVAVMGTTVALSSRTVWLPSEYNTSYIVMMPLVTAG